MDELKPCPSRWEHAVNLLNIYRNAHYNDPMGESCELANAINDILPFAVNAYQRAAPENKQPTHSIELTEDEITEFRHFLNAVKNSQTLDMDVRMSVFKLLHKFPDTVSARKLEGSEHP